MISPEALKLQDKVAVIATAKNFDASEINSAISIIESWGLKVVKGRNLFSRFHQFAGTDRERADDLQEALDREDIKAIFCARGGYGTSRIIDQIDFTKFIQNPKWIVGFSDVTVLISHLNRLGCEALHAVMPVQFPKPDYTLSVSALKETLFGKPPVYTVSGHSLNRPGESIGILTGGNLTILNTIISTTSSVDFAGKILFLEDIGEHLYHIDRMLVHLKRSGSLSRLKGLIAGHFTDMKDNETAFGKNAYEIIIDAVQEYDYPVCMGFPAGHAPDNFPLICGREITLKVETDKSLITFNNSLVNI